MFFLFFWPSWSWEFGGPSRSPPSVCVVFAGRVCVRWPLWVLALVFGHPPPWGLALSFPPPPSPLPLLSPLPATLGGAGSVLPCVVSDRVIKRNKQIRAEIVLRMELNLHELDSMVRF